MRKRAREEGRRRGESSPPPSLSLFDRQCDAVRPTCGTCERSWKHACREYTLAAIRARLRPRARRRARAAREEESELAAKGSTSLRLPPALVPLVRLLADFRSLSVGSYPSRAPQTRPDPSFPPGLPLRGPSHHWPVLLGRGCSRIRPDQGQGRRTRDEDLGA